MLTDVDWVPPPAGLPKGGFAADPFGVVADDGAVDVLFETFDRERWAGRIDHRRWDPHGGWGPSRVALTDEAHLSYPFLFAADGSLWCVPERAASRAVTLYRSSAPEVGWQAAAKIIEGVAALDPTLVWYRDRWWLWCTDAEDEPQACLRLWSAPELLGPWSAHPLDPVKDERGSARPAGTPFIVDGVLYRPAQDSTRTYGGRVVICRIDELDQDHYRETVVAVVEPDRTGPYPDGVHTLAAVGERTLVDGKRRAWAPRARIHRIASRQAGRLASRLGRRAR